MAGAALSAIAGPLLQAAAPTLLKAAPSILSGLGGALGGGSSGLGGTLASLAGSALSGGSGGKTTGGFMGLLSRLSKSVGTSLMKGDNWKEGIGRALYAASGEDPMSLLSEKQQQAEDARRTKIAAEWKQYQPESAGLSRTPEATEPSVPQVSSRSIPFQGIARQVASALREEKLDPQGMMDRLNEMRDVIIKMATNGNFMGAYPSGNPAFAGNVSGNPFLLSGADAVKTSDPNPEARMVSRPVGDTSLEPDQPITPEVIAEAKSTGRPTMPARVAYSADATPRPTQVYYPPSGGKIPYDQVTEPGSKWSQELNLWLTPSMQQKIMMLRVLPKKEQLDQVTAGKAMVAGNRIFPRF